MDGTLMLVLGLLLGAGIGVTVALVLAKGGARRGIDEAVRVAEASFAEAKVRLETELTSAQNQVKGLENRARNLDKDLKNASAEVQKREERVQKREETIDRKADSLTARELEVVRREKAVSIKEDQIGANSAEAEKAVIEARKTLERISGMNQDEARRYLEQKLLDEVKLSAARQIKQVEEEAKEEAEKRAKRIVGIAIMRYAGEYTNERTVSVVNLPSEEMKGRIIGREGRNIRAFEAATGVDVIIDDSPDAVIVSGFNPVRREIARLALEKLVSDGRIHPARIEEIVEKTTHEVDQKIKEAGEEALFQLALGTMHPDLVKLLGRMRYRTSYGQNVLAHSVEVGFICGMMASELGMNVKEARRAGLLHDLGKAVDHEVEGPHALVGANFARKYGESAEIVHAIAAHHDEEKPITLLAHLTAAADAISGARPGARRESLENYVKRLQELEEISNSFAGVERSFAIQAGREVRVLVEPDKVSDEGASVLSRDIAKKIEEKLAYPGQIRVCVIRETRAVDFAK
jgi:ribonuclease Y